MSVRRASGGAIARALLAAALAGLAGCAPMTPVPVSVVPPGTATSPATPGSPPTGGRPGRQPSPASAAADSSPSADAERVLASIPEPIAGSPGMPPPPRDTTRRAIGMAAPEAAYDTLRVERGAAGGEANVPVPSPTQPLGTAPQISLAAPPAVAVTPERAPSSPESKPAAPGATAASRADSASEARLASGECWRVQVAAPDEQAKAVSRRDAAQSLLIVPMVIEFEKGLHKVRTRDCMSREAASTLKARALDSGFEGAFIVNTAAGVPPARKPAPKPARKSSRSQKKGG